MKKYLLFLDETGMADLKTYKKSPYFILVGCLVRKEKQNSIRELANHIKYKYWSRTNVVFHSSDIGRKQGEFKILQDPKLYQKFAADLKKLISSNGLKTIVILIDKQKAIKKNWTRKTVYQRTGKEIIEIFLKILVAQNAKGTIISEYSSAEKDIYFYEAFAHFLARGVSSINADHKTVKRLLTSLTFATKRNFDTETQIADIIGHLAKHYQLRKEKKLSFNRDYSYEESLLPAFEQTLFATPTNLKSKRKKTIYKKLKSFVVLPKK